MRIFSIVPYGQSLHESIKDDCFNLLHEIKKGRTHQLKSLFNDLDLLGQLRNFIPHGSTLIPVPTSVTYMPNAVWPGLAISIEIANCFTDLQISTIIRREISVRRNSHTRKADERTTVQEHINSLILQSNELFETTNIILVDDVVTQGRTLIACREVLRSYIDFQSIPISGLSIFRSLFPDKASSMTKIVAPCRGSIEFYSSGKTHTTHNL